MTLLLNIIISYSNLWKLQVKVLVLFPDHELCVRTLILSESEMISFWNVRKTVGKN